MQFSWLATTLKASFQSMRLLCFFVLVCASLGVSGEPQKLAVLPAEPQKFAASRTVNHSFTEVRSAVRTYLAEAKTTHPSFAEGAAEEKPNRFTQRWFDCAGAPPGALMGEIIVTPAPGPLVSTHLEVRTDATALQEKRSLERRRQRTTETLQEIIALLERKR